MNSIVSGIYQHFPALGHKDFRRFFGAQLISLIGTWMQQASIPWLVDHQTHDAYMVGLVAALSTLPILFFTIPAGVFADRHSKKDILVWTQILLLVNAALFSLFSALSVLSMGVIIGLSIMRGLLMSFDIPVRQSFFRELVDRKALPSAIAVNSGVFNAARIIGPAIAGLFLAIGPTMCFLLNAVSFLGVIIVLFRMRPATVVRSEKRSGMSSFLDGFRYVRSHSGIRTMFFLLAVCSLFGWSYTTLLPTMSREVFAAPPSGYGFLLSSCGLGAFLGALTVGRMKDSRSLPNFLLCGWCIFIVALMCFACATSYYAGLLAIFAIGFGLTTLHVAGNSLVQTLVSDQYRGRVMGFYMFLWAGLGTFGSYIVGYMASRLGSSATLASNAVICLAAILLARFRIMATRVQLGLHVHTPTGADEPAYADMEAPYRPQARPIHPAAPPVQDAS